MHLINIPSIKFTIHLIYMEKNYLEHIIVVVNKEPLVISRMQSQDKAQIWNY